MSSVAGVVVVLLSVIAIIYRLRVKLYTRWKSRPFDRDECPGEDMDYDVFLCCSSLDDEPVGSRILDSLEANGYRVCYQESDFMSGLITDNIETSVTCSKRTVCLLTDNFIRRFVYVFIISLFCSLFLCVCRGGGVSCRCDDRRSVVVGKQNNVSAMPFNQMNKTAWSTLSNVAGLS